MSPCSILREGARRIDQGDELVVRVRGQLIVLMVLVDVACCDLRQSVHSYYSSSRYLGVGEPSRLSACSDAELYRRVEKPHFMWP